MLAFQPQGPAGQRVKQSGRGSRQKQDTPLAGTRLGSQDPFSQENVFQKPKSKSKGRTFQQDFKTDTGSSDRPRDGYSTVLSDIELQQDVLLGSFQIEDSTFRKVERPVRELPKFLIFQSPALHAGPIVQDSWDKENQDRMLKMESAARDPASLYEDFQSMREVERECMEEKGLVDKQGTRKTLEDAIVFRGSCLDMCPVYERVRRSIENDVRKYEKDQSGRIDKNLAIKAFSRPAAGQPPPLPSDVRPPQVLVKTLDFLIENTLDELPEAQSFLWDRTRSIRQDFTYQNFLGPEAVECHEKIVRIHILTLHVMAKSSFEYSQQQELEQMNKALKTLSEMYTEYRSRSVIAPNEAEFRAYYLLSQIRDPELDREIQSLPTSILQNEKVQLALNIRNMVQTYVIERGSQPTENAINLYKTFFQALKSGSMPTLMTYLVEIHLNEIRFYALKSLKRAIHNKSKPYALDHIKELLAFDHETDLEEFCTYYGIRFSVSGGTKFVDLLSLDHASHLIPDKKPLKQPFTTRHDAQITRFKDVIITGTSNVGNLVIPNDPIQFLDKQSSQGTGINGNPTLLQDTALLTSNTDLQTNELGQKRHQEMQVKLQRQEEEIRRKEEEESRTREADEEKRRLKEKADAEEKARLMEVKQRMIQKQEAKKKRRTDLVNSLGVFVFQSVLKNAVHDEVENALRPVVHEKLARSKKRENILSSFSEALFDAFIGELTYFESLAAVADVFREKALKKCVVKSVCRVARDSKRKADLRKRKREELLDASRSFGIPKVSKRKKTRLGYTHSSQIRGESTHSTNATCDASSSSVVAHAPVSAAIKNQPIPIDLNPLNFEHLMENLRDKPFDEFEMFFYSEEFESTTSKFLQRKFSISDGNMQKIFKKDDKTLKIIGTDKINPKEFENVSVLLFNCDGIEKIRTQRLLLKELVDGISLNTNFRFDIVVIYWEFEGIIQFTPNEIQEELRVPQHDAIREVKIIKLDPSLNTEKLQDSIDHMCEVVELTARGEYNQKYKQPSRPQLESEALRGINGKFTLGVDSSETHDVSSTLQHERGGKKTILLKNQKLMKRLNRYTEELPRARLIPKLLSSGVDGANGVSLAAPSSKGAPWSSSSSLLGQNLNKPKNNPQQPKIFAESPLSFGDMFKTKKNKLKVDVYSTPRPKSSDLLQTPSFAANSSSISNISNITFANNSISTPIISKPSYAEVAKGSIKPKSVDSEEGVPKSILELRKLAASVKERHGKKK